MLYGIDYETRTMSGRKMQPEKPEPITCQSCGARVSELFPCEWDADLMVGACCVVPDDSPDVAPACEVRRHIMDTAVTAGEMFDLLKAHKGAKCAHCESERDTVVSDRLALSRPGAVCCDAGRAA